MADKRSKDFQVSSTQDMTGLIPAGPVNEEELEIYEQLYPMYPQCGCIHRDSRNTVSTKKEDS